MMRNSNKLIIYPLIIISLCILCMPKLCSSAECCETFYCKTYSSRRLYYDDSVEYPFRVIGHQPESCGCPGFGLYCDDELGLLLHLPNAGNFTVDYKFHSFKEIQLSDPNECLPQRLLTDLDLATTPFRVTQSEDFLLYNCSGFDYPVDDSLYKEKIDCLSGLDYTVISERRSSFTRNTDPNCTFLKTVSVPTSIDLSFLSIYSNIDLIWHENECESCVEPSIEPPPLESGSTNDSGLPWKVVLGAILFSTPILLILIRYRIISRCCTQRINDTVENTTPTCGLDQITIDSYPTMILRDNCGGLTKSDHMCAICLSDYSPIDTLKILPHCLHRFHVDCIDIWLKSQPTCPICRTSPSQNLTDRFHPLIV